MKLCVDVRMLHASGIGTYLRGVLPYLARFLPKWKIQTLCLSNSDAEWCRAQVPGVECLVVPTSYYDHMLWLRPDVRRLCRQADVWWSPHYTIPIVPVKRLVVTIHDCAHLDVPESLCHKSIAHLLMRRATAAADAIVTVSRFSAERIADYFPYIKAKLRVAYNGIGEDWFAAEKAPAMHNRTFVVIGNNKPNKNIQFVVDAFKSEELSGMRLVVVGKQAGFISGGSLIEIPSMFDDRIQFLGHVDACRLKALLRMCCGLISPALYEGFSLTPLEALAAGVPIAVSAIPPHLELYQGYARLFDPRCSYSLVDSVRAISVMGEKERSDCSARGIAYARGFGWRRSAEAVHLAVQG